MQLGLFPSSLSGLPRTTSSCKTTGPARPRHVSPSRFFRRPPLPLYVMCSHDRLYQQQPQYNPRSVPYMSSDGEVVRSLVQSPLYFLYARSFISQTAEVLLDHVPSVHLWLARCLFVQQQLLETYAATLHDQTLSHMEDRLCLSSAGSLFHAAPVIRHAVFESFAPDVRACIRLECGIQRHFFREISAAKVQPPPFQSPSFHSTQRATFLPPRTSWVSRSNCLAPLVFAPSSKPRSWPRLLPSHHTCFTFMTIPAVFDCKFKCLSRGRAQPCNSSKGRQSVIPLHWAYQHVHRRLLFSRTCCSKKQSLLLLRP